MQTTATAEAPACAPLKDSEREVIAKLLREDPPTWMQDHFYIPDPRDPMTNRRFPPGPIILHPIQERILRAALLKIGGKFRYSTIVYSTIKKSGKTRLGAGVASWYAATQGIYNEVYCLANDGKQSSDRILSAIKQAVDLNPKLQWKKTKTRIDLPGTGTFIEAIPCDPSGSAGANPGMTVWSEMWGYRHEHKERLWSEMTIPPTRWGEAIRWVESYAGYEGESNVLYGLYELGVVKGYRHPAFPDLPIYINDAANMFCYWDEGLPARRMPWQQGPEGRSYYLSEAQILTKSEFERIHMNQWVQPVNKALPIEWWDNCQKSNIPPLDSRTPVIIGVDASVSGACSACAMVSRHPHTGSGLRLPSGRPRPGTQAQPDLHKTRTWVRGVRVFEPPRGGAIDLTMTVEATIREWVAKYNVIEVAYDQFQLHKMMTDLRRAGLPTRIYQFGQVMPRYFADKQLYDMVVHKDISHSGDPTLRQHVDNAMSKTSGEKFRFTTRDAGKAPGSRAAPPIDALIAVSMANAECLRLILP